MYKAEIEFTAYKDDYNEGQALQSDNTWFETLTAETRGELRDKILEATYSTELDDDQINEYDFATEYHTSYMANAENEGDASESELEAWKRGELDLWAINCHILVTEVIEKKASL